MEASKFTVTGPHFEFAVGSFQRSTTRKIGGFYVVNPNGRRCRAFAQGSAQKWTPALEAKLRSDAEAWAETLSNSSWASR